MLYIAIYCFWCNFSNSVLWPLGSQIRFCQPEQSIWIVPPCDIGKVGLTAILIAAASTSCITSGRFRTKLKASKSIRNHQLEKQCGSCIFELNKLGIKWFKWKSTESVDVSFWDFAVLLQFAPQAAQAKPGRMPPPPGNLPNPLPWRNDEKRWEMNTIWTSYGYSL